MVIIKSYYIASDSIANINMRIIVDYHELRQQKRLDT